MKKYEAKLSVSQWSKSGWVFQHDIVKCWEVKGNEVNEWIEDIKNDSPDPFDYVTDAFREWNDLPDYDEIDNEWTITIVEIREGGEEKFLGSTSIWESELAKRWFNN